MNSNSKVERILAGSLGDVLVGANTSSLESLRGDLLVLVADKVTAKGEVIDGSLLSAQVVYTDLWVISWGKSQRKSFQEVSCVKLVLSRLSWQRL